MPSKQGASAFWSNQRRLSLVFGLALIVVLGFVTVYSFRHMGSVRRSEEIKGSEKTRSFTASDFKWPALMKELNEGSLKGALKTEDAVFILYYIKEFNGVFADPEAKVFLGSACFAQVYNAEMDARLQSVFWTKALPKGIYELGSLLTDARPSAQILSERYPILTEVIRDLTRELPAGKMDRVFLLFNFPKILQAKARQDALTLFNEEIYGCSHEVTRRIYANAFAFIKSYNIDLAK